MILLISQSAAGSASNWDKWTAIGTLGAVLLALGLALLDLWRQRKLHKWRIRERENQFAVEQLVKLAELTLGPISATEKARTRVILRLLRRDEATLMRAMVGPEPDAPFSERTLRPMRYYLNEYADGLPYSDTDEFRSQLPTHVIQKEIADNIYHRNRTK